MPGLWDKSLDARKLKKRPNWLYSGSGLCDGAIDEKKVFIFAGGRIVYHPKKGCYPDLYNHLFGVTAHLDMTAALEEELRAALGRACQAQNVSVITRGRQEILSMPRDEILLNIERVAAGSLPLGDEWEFRRLLELYEQLDRGLLKRLVASGLQSQHPEMREAAEDFGGKL